MKGALFSRCRRIFHNGGELIFAPGSDFMPVKKSPGGIIYGKYRPQGEFFQGIYRRPAELY